MTADKFGEKIKDHFPSTAPAHIFDMVDAVKWNSDEQRAALFAFINENHPYKGLTFAKFRGLMKESGVRKLDRSVTDYAYRCQDCGQLYAGAREWFETYVCPACLGRNADIVDGPDRGSVRTYQKPCLSGWSGYIGGEEPKGPNICPVWGKGEYPYGPACTKYAGGAGTMEDCHYCSCRKCCEAMKAEEAELARGKTGGS